MSDLVERLRHCSENCGDEYLHELAGKAADRIAQLEAENASLSSWQCEFTDGKTGLVYGEGGSTYCAMAKRVQKLEAEVEEQVQWVKDLADLQIKAEARIAQLEAALRDFACDCTITGRCAVPDNCPNFQARRIVEDRT